MILVLIFLPIIYVLISLIWWLICKFDHIENNVFNRFNEEILTAILVWIVNATKASLIWIEILFYSFILFFYMLYHLLLDGFNFLKRPKNKNWRDDPCTEKQMNFADDLGIQYSITMTKGELSDLITKVTGE